MVNNKCKDFKEIAKHLKVFSFVNVGYGLTTNITPA